MKREQIFGRSGGVAVLDGFMRSRGSQPERRFGPGAVPAEAVAPSGAPAGQRPRRQDRVQDTATYHCSCGLVFEAEVDTTVGCPHCGTAQAW